MEGLAVVAQPLQAKHGLAADDAVTQCTSALVIREAHGWIGAIEGPQQDRGWE